MKIKSVHIDGFGKWIDQDFTFTANPQVIYGENEAGKTTLVVFIRSILFGFANAKGKNRFQQYRPRRGTAYGGSLLVEDHGQQYRISRTAGRDGGKVTVTDQQGRQFGREKLAALLDNVDRDLYQAIFDMKQASLTTISELNQADVQRHLQQLGAVDSKGWSSLVADLLKQGDEIFKPRGRKPVLNQHLAEYHDLQQRIQLARGKYDDYQRLLAARQAAEERIKSTREALRSDRDRLNSLERLVRLWPVFQQWQQGRQQVAVRTISDEQVAAADRLGIQEQELQRQIADQENQLAQLNGRLSQFDQVQLRAYHDQLPEYQALRAQLLQLAAHDERLDQQDDLRHQRTRELLQLQERYGKQPPQPLSERARGRLEQLTGQEPLSIVKPAPLLGLLGAGGLLCLLGLAGQHSFLKSMGLILIIAAACWGYYGYRQEKRRKIDYDTALAAFGRQHGLSKFPPRHWLAMQADLHRYAELSKELTNSKVASGGNYERLTAIKRRLAGKASGDTPGELARSLLEWENRQADQWQAWQLLRQQRQTAQRQLTDLKNRLGKVHNAKATIYQSVGVASAADFTRFLQQRAQTLHRQAAAAVYDQQLTEQDKAALDQFADEAALKQEYQRMQSMVVRDQADLENIQQRQQASQVQISSLATDGTLPELEQRAANLAARIWHEASQWTSYQLTAQWINQALILASADRYPAIIETAAGFFASLTDQRYVKILLDQDGVAVLTAQQERFAVEELSTGTAEQLYVALRLGFISVMSDQVALPIIIDDGFVNFDHLRKERVLDLLARLAQRSQVLYFTADERARQFAGVLDLAQRDSE